MKLKPWTGVLCDPHSVEDITFISNPVIESVSRLVLREIIWCRLGAESDFYIHFGWDYYMYIGAQKTSEKLLRAIGQLGLFIEEMASPYLDEDYTRQVRIAERVMQEEKDVLRKLSKS